MAAGAASLSDSSIRSAVVVVLLVLGGREVGVVDVLVARRSAVAASRRALTGSLDAGHEVAEDLLGDLEAALQLGDRLGRRLEQDDVVRALAVAVDRDTRAGGGPRARP